MEAEALAGEDADVAAEQGAGAVETVAASRSA